jgi:hypothetical protein
MLITLNVGFWNLEALESGLIGWLVPSGIVLVPACVAWLLPRVGAVLY